MAIKLSKKQQEIVECIDGDMLVIACPGAGKTTTMIARANNLVKNGIDEKSIIVMTFTKEAAQHMKNKYIKEFGPTEITFNTIHAVCFRILSELKGFTKENIITELAKWEFFANKIDFVAFSEKEEYIKNLIAEISFIKNKMMPIQDYYPSVCDRETFYSLYQAYERYKADKGLIDFDDMLLDVNKILCNSDEITREYAEKYKYIMVDEFQDTNTVQASLIYRIASGNLCCVGDDDQSIYGFRSADSSIMLEFPKKFPKCKKFFLDTNYRSEPKIIEYAGRLIEKNNVRFEKEFKVSKTGQGEVAFQKCKTMGEEATNALNHIKTLAKTEKLEEMAVLCRTNREHQLLAGKLLKEKIPFFTTDRMPDIHEERAFLDILSYYRLAMNEAKPNDFVSILNRPSRYLKKELFENCGFQKDKILKQCSFAKNKEQAIDKITQLFADLQILKTKKPSDFIKYLFFTMDYYNSYISFMEFIGKDKEESVQTLDMLKDEAEDFESMEEWFSYARRYGEILKEKKKEREGVCLSTYHSSKGLEWDNVVLLNANDGFSPHKKAETEAEIEEERRLFYVAFTRARKNVKVYYLNECGTKSIRPSIFLNDMGALKAVSYDNKEVKKTARKMYYGVRKGRKTGVYDSWIECQKQVKDYPYADYKGFDSYKDASDYVNANVIQKGLYYVVRKGIKPGIYTTWNECEKQVKNYENAKYKKCSTMEEARELFRNGW